MYVKSPMTDTSAARNLKRVDGNGTSGKQRLKHQQSPSDAKQEGSISFPRVKPWKVILGMLGLGALGLVYLTHIFTTQRILREVQQLEQQYEQTRQLHDDYQLMYDRLVGPTNIYRKANELGLINGGTAEQIIHVKSQGGSE
jgi:cell division protein FtsL